MQPSQTLYKHARPEKLCEYVVDDRESESDPICKHVGIRPCRYSYMDGISARIHFRPFTKKIYQASFKCYTVATKWPNVCLRLKRNIGKCILLSQNNMDFQGQRRRSRRTKIEKILLEYQNFRTTWVFMVKHYFHSPARISLGVPSGCHPHNRIHLSP